MEKINLENLNSEENNKEDFQIEKPVDKLDVRKFTKEYSPWARKDLADQIKIARLLDDLKNPESEAEKKEKIQKMQDEFYKRFSKQKEEFENSLDNRDIVNVAKKYGVFFVHSMPTQNINRWNTGMNNEAVDATQLTVEQIIENIKNSKPDLSCSSVSFKKRYSPNDSKQIGTMYPFGVVLRSGKILSTYRYDAGTLTESGKEHKKSKYDPETQDTSIQENPEQKIDQVLKRKFDRYLNPESGYYDGFVDQDTGAMNSDWPEEKEGYRGDMSGRDFDEFVISKPEIDGLFIDLDSPTLSDSWSKGERLDPINDIVQKYPNVPVYIKQKDEIKIYIYKEDGSVQVIDDLDAFEGLKSLSEAD
ncbi:MAG: hypothetical protein WCJ74_00735 [bacterium]